MKSKATLILPFLYGGNFEESRSFYKLLGFEETIIDREMSLFQTKTSGFYLNDQHLPNTGPYMMIVEDLEKYQKEMLSLELSDKFNHVAIADIETLPWGKTFSFNDPSLNSWWVAELVK